MTTRTAECKPARPERQHSGGIPHQLPMSDLERIGELAERLPGRLTTATLDTDHRTSGDACFGSEVLLTEKARLA